MTFLPLKSQRYRSEYHESSEMTLKNLKQNRCPVWGEYGSPRTVYIAMGVAAQHRCDKHPLHLHTIMPLQDESKIRGRDSKQHTINQSRKLSSISLIDLPRKILRGDNGPRDIWQNFLKRLYSYYLLLVFMQKNYLHEFFFPARVIVLRMFTNYTEKKTSHLRTKESHGQFYYWFPAIIIKQVFHTNAYKKCEWMLNYI